MYLFTQTEYNFIYNVCTHIPICSINVCIYIYIYISYRYSYSYSYSYIYIYCNNNKISGVSGSTPTAAISPNP